MEGCKTIEVKIDFFKTLFEKLTLILIALGGGVGTLMVKYYQKFWLLLFATAILWLVLLFGLW